MSNDIQPRLHPTYWYYTRSIPQILWTPHKKMDCGLWLTVNVLCDPQDEGFPAVLMSAATGCKLTKLGWNKIEHQNTFFQYFFHFYPISGVDWPLEMPYVFALLEVYMKTWFLYCFIKKWFHTILYHFNLVFHIYFHQLVVFHCDVTDTIHSG